jgi:hypothetical protein
VIQVAWGELRIARNGGMLTKEVDTGDLPVARCITVLRCSHGYRSRLHQRDKVPIRTHASELPRCLVEDGATTLEGRAGRVVGHEKHLYPTQGGP